MTGQFEQIFLAGLLDSPLSTWKMSGSTCAQSARSVHSSGGANPSRFRQWSRFQLLCVQRCHGQLLPIRIGKFGE